MKKIILACMFSAFYLSLFAQVDTQRVPKTDYEKDKTKYGKDKTEYGEDKKYDRNQKKTTGQSQNKDSINKDCTVKMVNGKVMKVTSDGTTVAIDKEMTLQNGTVVMTDGTVKMKDGKTMRIREGECMNMSGKVISGKDHLIQEGTK